MNRIDEEQEKFREFLQRLRRSRDRQEFDQYMAARRSGRPAPAIIDGDARAG
jgi:tRNA A-37 threonylcarbamoyl transferase component Bud32